MMEAKEYADMVITMDCDGQDDINAADEMLAKYYAGADIVTLSMKTEAVTPPLNVKLPNPFTM